MNPVRLRASVVCVFKNKILLVHLRDPHSGVIRLFPPGGQIESGESPVEAAERETQEETGVCVNVIPESEIIVNYPFFWSNRWVDCTTHFFTALTDSNVSQGARPDAVQVGVSWEPIDKIPEILAFDQSIAQAVAKLLPH